MEFPVAAKHDHCNCVVLFTDYTIGFLITKGTLDLQPGHLSDSWRHVSLSNWTLLNKEEFLDELSSSL